MNKILASYFTEKGIIVWKSMPYFHEQNGNVKHANRTAQATMKVLLRDLRLPRNFWGLVICNGTYLHD